VIGSQDWLRREFLPTVQQRGAAVIAARGLSSAASAANAALDHVRSCEGRTPDGHWFSAAVPTDGSYDVAEGLIFSMPVRSDGRGACSIVPGLTLSPFARERLALTREELEGDRAVVQDLLG
jgi:malate dehydrogenase